MLPLAAIQMGAGVLQTGLGFLQARKNQKALEKLQSPQYRQNAGIMDYYNKALQRYNVNPYTSQLYNQQQQQIKGGTAQGIASLQDRRSALAGIPQLIQAQNDSLLKAGAAAEGQQAGALSQLGDAANAKLGEDRMAFDINQMQPYQNKFNLLSQKAGAGNQIMNAGLSNIFGGLGSWQDTNMAKEIYGIGGAKERAASGGGYQGGGGTSAAEYMNSRFYKPPTSINRVFR